MRTHAWPVLVGLLLTLVGACAPHETPAPTTLILDVYASPAASPWLADLYACAPAGEILRVANDPAEAELVLRLGQPQILIGGAYQIGVEQLLVVTHRQNSLRQLSVLEARDLFAGTGDPAVQIWVYASGEDVSELFAQAVMAGRPLSSQARLAASPQIMAETIAGTPDAVGILPSRWQTQDTRAVYTLPDVPVLALVKEPPQGGLRELLACLQQ
jgi:hypothetical protein